MKVKLYPYYSHRRDPIVAALVPLINAASSKTDVAKKAGVGAGTLGKWCSGETKRPQFMTIAGVARSFGDEGIKAVITTIMNGK